MADPQKSKVVKKKKMETQLESCVVDKIENLETSNMLLATMVKPIMETSKKNDETCQRLETLLMKKSDQPISAIQHAGPSSVRELTIMADPQKSKVVKKKMETQLKSCVVDRIENLETSNTLLATMVKQIMETSKKNEETCQRLETLLMKRSDQPISAIQHAGQSSARDPWLLRRTMRITVQDETYKDDDNNTSTKRPRIQPEDGSRSRTFTLMVEPDDTIAALKAYIQDEQKIPFKRQKLLAVWGGVLKDEMTLGSVGIKEGTTLFLRYTPVKNVIVRTMTGHAITIMVEADDTVGDVKSLIQGKEGIRFHKQRLIFAGKQLESDLLLSDYNIESGAVLHLVLALCGC